MKEKCNQIAVAGLGTSVTAILLLLVLRPTGCLFWSIDHNHPVLAVLAIKAGADVNGRNADDNTPLMEAAWWGNTKIMDSLLANGAQIDLSDKHGWQAIHHAAHNAQDDGSAVRMLLERGASAESSAKKGVTPLMIAVDQEGGGSDANALELIARSDELNQRDADGATALSIATEAARYVVFRSLLRAGADPNIPDNQGRLPLEGAIPDVARIALLLGYGADPDIKCGNRPTPYEVIRRRFKIDLGIHEPDAMMVMQLIEKRKAMVGEHQPRSCDLNTRPH